MNIHLFNFISMSVVLILFTIYFVRTERKLRVQKEIIEGYQLGQDMLAEIAAADINRAALAEAKCRVYASIFGNDPLRYHAIARRNEDEGIGCKTPVVAVDLDGVILKYEKWEGPLRFDEPMPGVMNGLQKLRDMGFKIAVYTTRTNPLAPGGQGFSLPERMEFVANYLDAWHIPFDYICLFKPLASYYIDDRAIRFESWDQTIADIKALEKGVSPKAAIPPPLDALVINNGDERSVAQLRPGEACEICDIPRGGTVLMEWLGTNALSVWRGDLPARKRVEK